MFEEVDFFHGKPTRNLSQILKWRVVYKPTCIGRKALIHVCKIGLIKFLKAYEKQRSAYVVFVVEVAPPSLYVQYLQLYVLYAQG